MFLGEFGVLLAALGQGSTPFAAAWTEALRAHDVLPMQRASTMPSVAGEWHPSVANPAAHDPTRHRQQQGLHLER